MLTGFSIISFHSTFLWAILPPGLGCVSKSFSVKLKVLIFIISAAAPLPDPVVSLCSPCTILYPFLEHIFFHSFTLARLPLCIKRTSNAFVQYVPCSLSNFLISYMVFFLMTANTLKLTALALLRITISYCRRPPPHFPDVYSRLIVTTYACMRRHF